MAAPSRTAQFAKLHKILKKRFTPVAPDPNRSVLEHLLYASCLENAHPSAAEEAFAALTHTFFDWNEIRVSTVRELAEVLGGLPDPPAAANRVKRILQTVFEGTYSFELEDLRKQNIGVAVERLEKVEGTSKFTVAYVIQAALGGHSIPIDSGTMEVLRVLDLVTDENVAQGVVPGLDRAIPKPSGMEFGSLLHQLGADFVASPYAPQLHALLLEIEPTAKQRLPTRRAKREPAAEPPPADSKAKKPPRRTDGKEEAKLPEAAEEKTKDVKPGRETSKEPAKETGKKVAKPVPAELKKKAASKGHDDADAPKTASAEPVRKKEPPVEKKHAAGKKKVEPAAKKKSEHGKGSPGSQPARRGSAAEGLSKRKPR